MKSSVKQHLELCKGLVPDQITALGKEWGQYWYGQWDKRAVIRYRGRLYMESIAKDVSKVQFEEFIGGAAYDVVVALAAKDRLLEEEFEDLVAPWAVVMGRTWEKRQ